MKLLSDKVTDGQRRHVIQLVEKVVNRAITEGMLDRNNIQKLIENGDKFQAAIVPLIKQYSVSNKYANEEVNSNYTYPREYKGPKPIEEQIKVISETFDLDPTYALEFVKNLPALPGDAEGWFAIPSVDALVKKYFPGLIDPARKHCRVIHLICQKIAAFRSFSIQFDGHITSDSLRINTRTAHALNLIAETQLGDILIIAAQLGLYHRAKSVRRAREVFMANEFGLGVVEIGSILITHPERIVRWEELDIDCPGNEFSPNADGDFSHAPCFYLGDGKVRLGMCWIGAVRSGCGSASGFLPA